MTKLLYKFKFAKTRRVLWKISKTGKFGFKVANFIYWHGIRKYQERIYDVTTGDPSVEITTRVGCPNRCKFCPQEVLIKEYKKRGNNFNLAQPSTPGARELNFDTFKMFLSRIPKNYVINFGGFSDPWLVPDCTAMVVYAHERGYRIRVFTTLTEMNPVDIRKLSGIPFELFSIHVADELPTTRIPMDDKLLKTLQKVKEFGLFQLEFHNHVGNPHPYFINMFGGFDIRRADVVDRAGNAAAEGNKPLVKRLTGKIRCGFNPQSNDLNWHVLLPNGGVVLCCEDYGLKHVLGNLNISELSALYNNETYQTIKGGLDDESVDLLCRYCHRAVQIEK